MDAFYQTANEVLDRLCEVTSQLHHGQGDRETLQLERVKLLEQAKGLGLIGFKRPVQATRQDREDDTAESNKTDCA